MRITQLLQFHNFILMNFHSKVSSNRCCGLRSSSKRRPVSASGAAVNLIDNGLLTLFGFCFGFGFGTLVVVIGFTTIVYTSLVNVVAIACSITVFVVNFVWKD